MNFIEACKYIIGSKQIKDDQKKVAAVGLYRQSWPRWEKKTERSIIFINDVNKLLFEKNVYCKTETPLLYLDDFLADDWFAITFYKSEVDFYL